jgi:hypothetical protein
VVACRTGLLALLLEMTPEAALKAYEAESLRKMAKPVRGQRGRHSRHIFAALAASQKPAVNLFELAPTASVPEC